MESNSESPRRRQRGKNVKQIIDVSKERNCWSSDELEGIKTTYHNVCEIAKQLQAEQPQEPKRFEEIKEQAEHSDDKKLDESVEIEEMENVD